MLTPRNPDADSRPSTRLLVVAFEPERGQSHIAQSHHVAFAAPHSIDDALGDDLVDDRRLPGIVKLLAGVSKASPIKVVKRSSKAVPVFRINGRMDATLLSLAAKAR